MPKKTENPIDEIILELKELTDFDDIDPKIEAQIFKDLATVDGLQEYLSQTLAQDLKRYFQSPPGAQLLVKGAFNRTLYLKNKIKKHSEVRRKKVEKNSKMKSKRHL